MHPRPRTFEKWSLWWGRLGGIGDKEEVLLRSEYYSMSAVMSIFFHCLCISQRRPRSLSTPLEELLRDAHKVPVVWPHDGRIELECDLTLGPIFE